MAITWSDSVEIIFLEDRIVAAFCSFKLSIPSRTDWSCPLPGIIRPQEDPIKWKKPLSIEKINGGGRISSTSC